MGSRAPPRSLTFGLARFQGGRSSLPDQSELDVTVDYRMPEGRFRGFWIRLRGALAEQSVTGDSVEDYRPIVNYETPSL